MHLHLVCITTYTCTIITNQQDKYKHMNQTIDFTYNMNKNIDHNVEKTSIIRYYYYNMDNDMHNNIDNHMPIIMIILCL